MDENKKRHRPERLKGYNYSKPGYYFVTFNTKVRYEEILCRIEQWTVGPDPLGGPFPQGSSQLDGVRPHPVLRLTEAGNIVQKLIQNVDKVYLNAYVDCYVIMPDHVHMVICLKSQAGLGSGRDVSPGRLSCSGDTSTGKLSCPEDTPTGTLSCPGDAPTGKLNCHEDTPTGRLSCPGDTPTGKLSCPEDTPTGRLSSPGDAPPRGSGPTKNCSVPKIVNAIKSMSTRELGYKLWQDDYYDHIIRNKHELQATRQYIQENPQKWLQDKD